MKFSKGDKVSFCVQRGEHNMLAGRPGEVVGRRGRYIVVRCTEVGTAFRGQEYLTPKANLRKSPD
jgi:ribosomal protein L21E